MADTDGKDKTIRRLIQKVIRKAVSELEKNDNRGKENVRV